MCVHNVHSIASGMNSISCAGECSVLQRFACNDATKTELSPGHLAHQSDRHIQKKNCTKTILLKMVEISAKKF